MNMGQPNSPLRYPGGKAKLSHFLSDIMIKNGIQDGTYIEPYAGGAGAALNLLYAEHVERIILNDVDPCIYAFWEAVLCRKNDFIKRLKEIPISIDEWRRQREIYLNHKRYSKIKVAVATFYLNRCNRSGIIVNGGPVGGYEQAGKWKINARFNKDELIRRIEKVHLYRDRIDFYNLDAIDFLDRLAVCFDTKRKMLIYLDPPYYVKGSSLYLNHYDHDDHVRLASYLQKHHDFHWLLTYDNVPEINALYREYCRFPFDLLYTAHSRKMGSELLIHSKDFHLDYRLLYDHVQEN